MAKIDLDKIDAKFVDVDFGTQGLATGALPRPATPRKFRSYGDQQIMVPSSQWKAEAAAIQAAGGGSTQLITRIFNQANEGSCVGNAGTQADQIVQAKQWGKDRVTQLSASSLYKQIGSSPNSGAMVDDAIDAMEGVGILPLDTPENRAKFGDHVMPHTGFRVPFPSGWKETAKKFKAHEWFAIESVDEMFSALLNQHPVVVGRAGHSIVYCDLVYKGDSPNVCYANSWGSWGFGAGDFDAGFGLDTMNLIRSSSYWAFALCSVVDPS